jgi:hypothetical protein
MTFAELNEDQRIQLKQRILVDRNEAMGEGTSYGELANADELVSDEDLEACYDGTEFSPDDFGTEVSPDDFTQPEQERKTGMKIYEKLGIGTGSYVTKDEMNRAEAVYGRYLEFRESRHDDNPLTLAEFLLQDVDYDRLDCFTWPKGELVKTKDGYAVARNWHGVGPVPSPALTAAGWSLASRDGELLLVRTSGICIIFR